MYSLLRRRTMMTKPSVVPTERLIYQLYDYTCDGTINTFIDTGIKLFGIEYVAFRIEIEYDGLDIKTRNLGTLLECKSFGSAVFTPGLSTKVGGNSNGIALNIYPCIIDYNETDTSSATVILTYDSISNSSSINVNGSIKTGSGRINHREPLTIGGRYSSHLSNPDRFVQFHISSLKIYATPSGIDPSYIYIPLTFKCLTGGDLSIKNTNGSYDRNFEYSLNGGAWTAFDLPKNTASKLIATLSPNDTISFRRDNENFYQAQFISDSNLTFDIYGNLLSLQYGSNFSGQTELRNTSKQAFGPIFQETNVVDASKLMLTATTLSNGCYSAMFWNCTYLTHAPEIYATTLVGVQGHFQRMFSGCSSLIKPPSALYVSTLAVNCYNEMFSNCRSLTYAPDMSAVINASGHDCCNAMFKECTSLVSAPELSATTLSNSCYKEMFYNCTSLTIAPELPAKTLAEECYSSMFRRCTNLVTIPTELPATTLKKSCYQAMFYGCTSLTNAPELPAMTLATYCYCSMFNGCTSLISAPELPATTLVESCYQEMFYSCTSLNYIKCLATDISAANCTYDWVGQISHRNGVFVKNPTMSSWTQGSRGYPWGWTVIDAN